MRYGKILILLIVSVLTGSTALVAQNAAKSTAITIYNSNLGVVKEVRGLNFGKGISSILITDVAQLIDPTTVKFSFDGEVLEQNYQYDLVSMEKILQRYIDRDIQLIAKTGDLLEGTLLSIYGSQVVLKKKDGGLLMLPNVNEYRFSVESLPEGLITRPTLQCLASTKKAGQQDVQVSYQTAGMNWHAEYVAVLDKNDKKMDFNSWVSLENHSGTSFKDAEVKLIAGDINQVHEIQPVYAKRKMETMAMDMAAAGGQFEEKAFFEYHIYEMQRKTTVANNETKQVSLFERSDISMAKKYLYISTGSTGNDQKADVVIEFENKEANNLGIPMPKGKVRIYKATDKSMEFVGEDLIDHTPKDEKITLKVGKAFDIVIKEEETDNKRITDRINEVSYKITVKNRKDENVTVEVRKSLYGFWKILDPSIEYTKTNANLATFQVPVKAGEEKELTFRVRYQY